MGAMLPHSEHMCRDCVATTGHLEHVMADVWSEFSSHVGDLASHLDNHVVPTLTYAPIAGLYASFAKLHADLLAPMLLLGHDDHAVDYAKRAEKLALKGAKSKRKKPLAPWAAGLTGEMARSMSWFIVYNCHWLTEGKEDTEALESALSEMEAAIAADASRARPRWKLSNFASYAQLAARLEKFDVAFDFAERSDGLISTSTGYDSQRQYRDLFLRTCARLAGKTTGEKSHAEIVGMYRRVFAEARSGDVKLLPFGNGNFESLLNLSYFGVKYFYLTPELELSFKNVAMQLRGD